MNLGGRHEAAAPSPGGGWSHEEAAVHLPRRRRTARARPRRLGRQERPALLPRVRLSERTPAMTTTEYDYALDMRMRLARRAVVRPLTGREVALAVREARDQGLELGLDLSAMKRIVIDPRERTARIQPGVSTRELEDAAAPHDLAPLLDHRGVVAANLLAAQVVRPG